MNITDNNHKMFTDHTNKLELPGSTRSKLSAELTDLLIRLDLSTSVLYEEEALAIDKNSSCSSGPESVRNADIDYGYPDRQDSPPANTIDRKGLIEEFSVVRSEGKIYEAQNNFFHDQLVQHYKRKQMMRVYDTESDEDDSLTYKYKKKLSKYEQLRQELQSGEEDFREESTILKDDLRKKMDDADAAMEDLVSKERAAGAQCYTNGKPLPVKEIQALITRNIAKIKEISKIRVRYARLRDSLVEKEVVFDALNILSPNLDQKDYERLGAENFYFKHELRYKEREVESLANRQKRIVSQLAAIRRKRNKLTRVIQTKREHFEKLKLKIAEIFQRKRIRRRKMKEVTKYFEKFEFILGLRMYPEVNEKMNYLQYQHKECFERIATLITEIKQKDICLKDLKLRNHSHELTATTVDNDSDENISIRQKSRRPPLGGGFLQAL